MKKKGLHPYFSLLSVIILTLAVLLAFSPSETVYAASITVNASCSLSDAITAANTDTATGGCLAGNGADTITLSVGLTLGAELPNISSEITIEGAGYTISGNNRYRIFDVESGGNLRIRRLSLSNGKSGSQGGAIYNLGSVTITNSTFNGNGNSGFHGGAIYNTGTLTITNSTFYGIQVHKAVRSTMLERQPSPIAPSVTIRLARAARFTDTARQHSICETASLPAILVVIAPVN